MWFIDSQAERTCYGHLLQNPFLYSKTTIVPIGEFSDKVRLVSNFIKQYPSIYSYFVNKVK